MTIFMNIFKRFSKLHKMPLILVLFIVTHFSLCSYTQSKYFVGPHLYSPEELIQELKEKTLEMSWHFGQDNHFRFVSRDDEVYFEICLGNLPDTYSDFVAKVKDKFIQDGPAESKRLIFSYKITNSGKEEINIPQSSQKQEYKEHPDKDSYVITDKRIIKNARPKSISQDELVTIIKNKKILFYTGAGLSFASGVPTMDELEKILGLEFGKKFFYSLANSLDNPREFASKIRAFHKACLFSSPTKAHCSLKELAIFKNTQIITENLDCLHEASGVYPYRINTKRLKNEIETASLTQFDYVICIGLSHDDRGFLGWYKQYNPQGKIIAIDLEQPSYLGDEDFLMTGDLQEIIPLVQEKVIGIKD